jgi:hypothetical protein
VRECSLRLSRRGEKTTRLRVHENDRRATRKGRPSSFIVVQAFQPARSRKNPNVKEPKNQRNIKEKRLKSQNARDGSLLAFCVFLLWIFFVFWVL